MRLDTRSPQTICAIGLLLLGLMLSTGCASTVTLTKPVRESIRSVSVNPDVKVTDDVFYRGPGQSVGMLFGLIGALVAEAAAQGPKGQIKAVMTEAQINLGQIVREQFVTELVATNIFPSLVPEGGDGEVRLEVLLFGLAQTHDFSSQLVPWLGVLGSLVRADGSVLWQKQVLVTSLNKQTPAHTLEEYLQNPQLLREAITVAAQIVSDELMKHMRQD